MVKNTLTDLDNHLFEALERLNDDELSDDELARETKRAQAISEVSRNIIANSEVKLKAIKMQQEYFGGDGKMPLRLE